jgi:hypothetical protein
LWIVLEVFIIYSLVLVFVEWLDLFIVFLFVELEVLSILLLGLQGM